MIRSAIQRAMLASILLAAVAGLGCPAGGVGGSPPPAPPTGPMGPMGLTAMFAPGNTSPGALTVSMNAGSSNMEFFDVDVQVTGIGDFYGAAFRILYDPASVNLLGFDSTGSFIDSGGATVSIDAVAGAAGEIIVTATRVGQIEGVPLNNSPQLLISLMFEAIQATAGNNFTFGPAASRFVQTCPSGNPLPMCSMVPDNTLTWSGGVLTAN